MKHLKTIAWLSLILPFSIKAQKLTTTTIQVKDAIINSFLFNGSAKMLSANSWGKQVEYHLFDSGRMSLIRRFESEKFEINGSNAGVYSYFHGDKIYELGVVSGKRNDNVTFATRVIDLNGKVTSPVKEIFAGIQVPLRGSRQVYSSANNRFHCLTNVESDEDFEIKAMLFDYQFNRLKEFTFKFPAKKLAEFTADVSNEGRVVLRAVYNDEDNEKTFIEFFSFTPTDDAIKQIKLEKKIHGICQSQGKFYEKQSKYILAGVFMAEDANNRRVVKQYPFNYNGFYFVKLNTRTFELEDEQFRQFGNSEMNWFYQAGASGQDQPMNKEHKWITLNSKLQTVRLNPDGSVRVIIEWSSETEYRNKDGFVTKTVYRAGNAHFVDIVRADTVLRIFNLSKYHQTDNQGSTGCHVFQAADQDFILFNDHSKVYEGGVWSQRKDYKDLFDVNVPCVAAGFVKDSKVLVYALTNPSDKAVMSGMSFFQYDETCAYISVRTGIGNNYQIYRVVFQP